MVRLLRILRKIYFCSLTLFLLTFIGCKSSKPKAYNFEMILDEGLANMSVELNLVGITELEKPIWEQLRIDEYWESKLYKDAEKKVFKFGQGQSLSQNLHRKDPIWKTWLSSGVNNLFVIGDIPGVTSTSSGSGDPRALILPLAKSCWKGKTIQVEIDSSQVRPITPIQCRQ